MSFIAGTERTRQISQQGTLAFLNGRPSFMHRVAAYLQARPNTWIDGMVIAQIGGCYASRTRISECRRKLHMTIENKVITLPDKSKRSLYRFVP